MPEFFRVCLLNKQQHSRASYEQTLSISPGYATGPRSIAVLDAKGTMLMEVTPLPLFRTVAPWVVSGNPDVHPQLPPRKLPKSAAAPYWALSRGSGISLDNPFQRTDWTQETGHTSLWSGKPRRDTARQKALVRAPAERVKGLRLMGMQS